MKKTLKCINIEDFLDIINENALEEFKIINTEILDENNNNISKYIITNLKDIQYIKFYNDGLRTVDIFLYNKTIIQEDNKFINKHFYNLETLENDKDMIILKTENYNLLNLINKFEIIPISNQVEINLEKEEDKNYLISYLNKKLNVEINNIINLSDHEYYERNNKIINENTYKIEHVIDTLSTSQLIVSERNLIILDKKKRKFI